MRDHEGVNLAHLIEILSLRIQGGSDSYSRISESGVPLILSGI